MAPCKPPILSTNSRWVSQYMPPQWKGSCFAIYPSPWLSCCLRVQPRLGTKKFSTLGWGLKRLISSAVGDRPIGFTKRGGGSSSCTHRGVMSTFPEPLRAIRPPSLAAQPTRRPSVVVQPRTSACPARRRSSLRVLESFHGHTKATTARPKSEPRRGMTLAPSFQPTAFGGG